MTVCLNEHTLFTNCCGPIFTLLHFILHSHSYSFRTDVIDLNLYLIKGALALFVLVSGYVCYIKLYTQLSGPR